METRAKNPMKQSEFLKKSAEDLEAHIKRVEAVAAKLTDEQLSKDLDSGLWGVGRILDHVNIANEPYIKSMRGALTTAPPDNGSFIKPTIWGRTLARVAGPDGKAPAPRKMVPQAKQYNRQIVDRWIVITRELAVVAKESEGKDINRAKFRNPFFGLIRMNVTDGFTVGIAHTERHVRQIEERVSQII